MKRLLPLSILCALAANVFAADAPPLPKEVTKIAFGSCCRQDKPAPIFDAITAAKPDVMIWLGDNIYGDSDDPDVIKAKYAALAAKPEFQRLHEKVPFLYVWDDHDYGKNDAGGEYKFKDQNKQIMLDFFGEPKDSDRRKREGNYDSIIIGPEGRRVQFLLLDTRSFRSPMKQEMRDKVKWNIPNEDEGATILGEAQWKWLEEELSKPADLRVLCSSIQVIATTHRFEKWANFPKERDRLLNLINGKVSIVMSGDRHHGGLYEWKGKNTIIEATSSSFNQPGRATAEDGIDPARTGGPFEVPHFAYLEVRWDGGVPRIVFEDAQSKPLGR